MATKFCNQCGAEIAPGKRFCGRCGAPVQPQASAQAPTEASLEAPAPANPLVVRLPVELAPAEPATPLAAHPAPAPVSIPEQRPPLAASHSSGAQQVQKAQGAAWTEHAVTASSVSEEVLSKRRGFPRFVIVAAVALLLLAGGAFGFYKWHTRWSNEIADDSSSQTASPDASTPAASSSQPADQPAAETPAPARTVPDKPSPDKPSPDKPSPDKPRPDKPESDELDGGSAVGGQPGIAKVSPAPGTALPVKPTRPLPVQPESLLPPPSPTPARPAPVSPAPIIRLPPAPADGGVLRYSGPPVHLGQEINFNGLPGVMLRFSFDHASWQPHITKHPDGTQTLTLRSLTLQDQTQCEVQWQIAR
jgi:hypothetical protein